MNQSRVQGVQIKNIKDLDEKFVKANLGTMDKEIGSRMKFIIKFGKYLKLDEFCKN